MLKRTESTDLRVILNCKAGATAAIRMVLTTRLLDQFKAITALELEKEERE